MNAFDQYEVWFVTGAQLLYGGDAVIAVDAHSNEMVAGLNASGKLPVKVVYKGTPRKASMFPSINPSPKFIMNVETGFPSGINSVPANNPYTPIGRSI